MLRNGNINTNSMDNIFKLPIGKIINSIELIHLVYPDFQTNYINKGWLSEICILRILFWHQYIKFFTKVMKNY